MATTVLPSEYSSSVEQDIQELAAAWKRDEEVTLYTGELLYKLREKYRGLPGPQKKDNCNPAVNFKSIYQRVGIPERTVFDRIAKYEHSIGLRDHKLPGGAMCERFYEPPFTVLDGRSQRWLDRKRAWLELGIKSEVGRDGKLLFDN